MMIRISIESNEKKLKSVNNQIKVIAAQYETAAQKYRTVWMIYC